jgi:acetate kinase
VRVLVVNAGSSSLKLSLLEPPAAPDQLDRVIAADELEAPRSHVDERKLRAALRSSFGDADAIGHRIVHGGERYRTAVRIDRGVRAALEQLVALAPLHQPKSLAALDAVSELLPDLPAVACFDTAFHATLTPAASTYALPASWRERWGLRRYGFHGLSHAWVARRTTQLLARPARIVSCHLGAGASLCAIGDGRSLDTTMGFTPLEGLVMATRSGSVDPGMLLWLGEPGRLDSAEIADALEHRSGLLGLAGSADMREICQRARDGEASAQLALDVYVHRLRAGVAAMSAALGGLDALAFTGGVGERSAEVRARTAEGLGFLGVAIDGPRNDAASAGDAELSAPDALVRTFALHAREDLEIARQTRSVLAPTVAAETP